MRDTRKPKAFYDEFLASKQEVFHNEDQFEIYRRVNEQQKPEFRKFAPLTNGYCRQFAADIPVMYSRGDSLQNIYDNRGAELGNRYASTAQEIVQHGYSQRNYFNSNLVEPHGLHEAYSILCWLLCFGCDPQDLAAIAPEFGPAGQDRLIDTILSRYQPDREVADSSGHPATFQLIDDVVTANPEERVAVLTKYMKDWGKLLSNLNGLASIGIFRKRKLTNKTLDKDVGGAYVGYWMWEVALLVKFFDIDDSSFVDNEFYPADLVRFIS
jgi:hypothetical protein